jgi:hypothetical protein
MKEMYAKNVRNLKNCVVIVEESHNFINGLHNDAINARLIYREITAFTCKVVFLSGTPIVSNSKELALLCNICKSSKDPKNRYAPLFEIEKNSLDSSSEIETRMFGFILFSEGKIENYPELLPVKEIFCEYND